jgi:hypothetical protein
MEDVDHHLEIVEHYPLASRETIDRSRSDRMIFFQPRLDLAGNRFDMRLGCGRADDKEIGESGNASQIQDDDSLCLLVRGKFAARSG